MPPLLQLLLRISWQAASLAAVVWLITRLTRQAPAAWRHALWLIVVAKFFVPPLVPFPADLAFWQTAEHTGVGYASAAPKGNATSAIVEILPDQPVSVPSDPELATEAIPTGRSVAIQRLHPAHLLEAAWLLGVSITGGLLVTRCVRQSRLIRGSASADRDVMGLIAELAGDMGMHRVPEVRLSSRVRTPMLFGILRPLVVLPEGIESSCNRGNLRAMLLHELAHISRWDMAGVLLYQFAKVLFFFHPGLWLAGRYIKKERELACDEFVLSHQAISRKDYAAGYVSALRLACSVPAVATALAMAEPLEMEKRRLEMILRNASSRQSTPWVGALVLVMVIGLPTFAGVRARAEKAPTIRTILKVLQHQNKATIEVSCDISWNTTTSGGGGGGAGIGGDPPEWVKEFLERGAGPGAPGGFSQSFRSGGSFGTDAAGGGGFSGGSAGGGAGVSVSGTGTYTAELGGGTRVGGEISGGGTGGGSSNGGSVGGSIGRSGGGSISGSGGGSAGGSTGGSIGGGSSQSGSFSGGMSVSGTFEPTPHRYVRTPEMLYKESDKQKASAERKGADGLAEGRTLSRDRKGKWVGTVRPGPVSALSDWCIQDRMETILYPLYPRKDDPATAFLYGWLKYGKVSQKKEKIEGHDCWKVTIANTGDCIVKRYEIWLDPAIGFCPRRISMRGGNASRGGLHTIVDFLDYKEAAEGIWFPTKLTTTEKTVHGTMTTNSVRTLTARELYGDREYEKDELKVTFDPGTEVFVEDARGRRTSHVVDANGVLVK